MWTERSRLAVRVSGSLDFHAPAFATVKAWLRPAAGNLADVVGRGSRGDSSVCPSAHCELAFFSPLVCGAGPMARMGTWPARKSATMDSLVFPRLDITVGESARGMALRHSPVRDLCLRRVGRQFASAGCLCCSSRLRSGPRHVYGFVCVCRGNAREPLWLASARPHRSLSQ